MIERNFVTCPVCEEKFSDHEGLAGHCLVSHSDYGANGYEQDYTIHSFTFDSMEMFETWLKEKCENTACAVMLENVNRMVNEDSSEANDKLASIYDLIDRASRITVSSHTQELKPYAPTHETKHVEEKDYHSVFLIQTSSSRAAKGNYSQQACLIQLKYHIRSKGTLDEADFIEYHPQSMTTRTFLGFWYFRRTKMMLSIDLLDPRHPTPGSSADTYTVIDVEWQWLQPLSDSRRRM
ncbi:unnamed protein product [Nippostrongylus brasiliensis]|uniref:C2H2-type domain-containing protein n=1 Tax=Nippostrongylus brasiliensis TaxID=27835 RepID=A0A0N4YWF1_NIPBR|nr:unnamed protein product [Nippostrongylus brasiliensis]